MVLVDRHASTFEEIIVAEYTRFVNTLKSGHGPYCLASKTAQG